MRLALKSSPDGALHVSLATNMSRIADHTPHGTYHPLMSKIGGVKQAQAIEPWFLFLRLSDMHLTDDVQYDSNVRINY